MFKGDCGKLMVYTSVAPVRRGRLRSVSSAAERTARLLNLGFEVVRFKKSFSPIYVYYENGGEEPIPIYCDEGKSNSLQEICAALKGMMFVLSFHPRHSALRRMREGLMRLS
jgi:hypothetical protein